MEASERGKPLFVGPNVKLSNIVVGDVWLCAGPSNMEMRLGHVQNAENEIAGANFPLIRQIELPTISVNLPQPTIVGSWLPSSPSTAAGFTAVGYFFARTLYLDQHVPIGLINACYIATKIERWIAPEGFRMVPSLSQIADSVDATLPTTARGHIAYQAAVDEMAKWVWVAKEALRDHRIPPEPPQLPPTIAAVPEIPTTIYNGMIHPLVPFAIRGVIWYQGESNSTEGDSYFHKMQALIAGWRKIWNQGDFPFYFVQIANYGQPSTDPAGDDGWAPVRDAQRRSLVIKNTGMAVTIDVGDSGDLHPKNKQDVGARLALWALARDYGKTNIVFSGPLYRGLNVEGNAIRVYFDSVGSGLIVGKKSGLLPTVKDDGGRLQRFAIAAADKRWRWAEANIDGASVVVSSPEVVNPVAVRYAYSMNPEGANLYNQEGLPASPFRTDDW
jgi:sialate O-acetylesterase